MLRRFALDILDLSLQNMRAGIVRDLENVEAQLDAEAKEDESARQHYGEREWPLQDASVVTANLRDRIDGYKCGPSSSALNSLSLPELM